MIGIKGIYCQGIIRSGKMNKYLAWHSGAIMKKVIRWRKIKILFLGMM